MEVIDYLKLARRRLWILVIIPMLAAAAVLGHWQLSAKTYEATAYVFMPGTLAGSGNQFSGPAGTAQWVNEFSAAAVSPQVVREAAEASGVPAADITQRLRVTQQGQSAQLDITFPWTRPRIAESVVKHVAGATPKAIFAPPVAQARQAVTQAQASLKAANQNILAASTAWGDIRPDLSYAAGLKTLVGLENARAGIKAGAVSARAAADARIKSMRAQVATLQHDVGTFENLNARRQAATMVLARAQEGLLTADAQYAGAVGAVTMLPVKPAEASSTLIKGVLSAVVGGILLGLCLIAALELFRPSGDTSRHPAPLGKEADQSPWTDQPPAEEGISQQPTGAEPEAGASGLVNVGAAGGG